MQLSSKYHSRVLFPELIRLNAPICYAILLFFKITRQTIDLAPASTVT